MTLDEAIKHCEEVADNKEQQIKEEVWEKGSLTEKNCYKCAEEHRQLAEWLKELKDYRERMPSYEAGYNDAKREIALSGEYERAYERGKADAIQALQEPTGDLISRQAVLSYINRIQNQGTGKKKSFEFIQKFVEKLSSAEKTGHWKRISIDKYTVHAKHWYRCDRCGEDNLGNTDWCPNCGANMSENPTGSKDVIWHDKRNYSEIVVEPQESEDKE